MEVHLHAYRTDDEWTIVAVMRDITESKEGGGQVQGCYFSRPLPAAELGQLLLEKRTVNERGQ